MKSSPARIASFIIIGLFLGSAGFIGGSNGHLFSILPGLQENTSGSVSASSGYSVSYYHYNFNFNLNIKDNNPLSQWTPSGANAYVISVPSGSTFSQYIQPSISVTGEFDYHGTFGEVYGQREFTIAYTETTSFTPYNQYGSAGNTITLAKDTENVPYTTGGSGYGPQETTQFSAVSINYNQTNQWNSMFGIITVSVGASISSGSYIVWNPLEYMLPSISQTQGSVVTGQIYSFPGTGTLNIPNPQAVVLGNNNYTTISGTMDYGTYTLVINGPGGFAKVYNLGTSTQMDKGFSVKFIPTQLGNYTVFLTNSVVNLRYQNLFGVSATFNQPSIIVNTNAGLSGYYKVNQTIHYTVTLSDNTTLPLTFIINVYDGQPNVQTTNQAYEIVTNEQVSPSYNSASHIWTYLGSFEINAGAGAMGYVTITASAFYHDSTTNEYVRSVMPGTATLEVAPPTPAPVPVSHSYLGYIEGIGVLAIAGVIAYIDPETTGIKLGIIASGAVLAMVLIGVI